MLVTGGWQELAPIQEGLAKGHFDMITSARTFMANMDLPKQLVAASKRGDKNYTPKSPCDACNRCLVAAPKHPVMCMSAQRFGGDVKAMQDAGQRMYTQPPKRQTVRRLPVVQKH